MPSDSATDLGLNQNQSKKDKEESPEVKASICKIPPCRFFDALTDILRIPGLLGAIIRLGEARRNKIRPLLTR